MAILMSDAGLCRLCGSSQSVLTKEHIPPKSTGNFGTHQVELLQLKDGKRRRIDLPDGFALTVLCGVCNTSLGSRLGTTFAAFVQQVQQSGRFISPRGGIFSSILDVFPARLHRQLMLTFLCLQPPSAESQWQELREYVRSRSGKAPSEAPRIGLYYNVSNTYRVVPVAGVSSLGKRQPPWVGAEITAPGLGVVFTFGDSVEDSPWVVPKLHDVSDWGQLEFSERGKVVLELPRYRVEAPHPLAFGTAQEVDKWQSRNAIIWLATRFDTSISADVGALIWRPVRRELKRRPASS